jgi:hypothetical protein
MAYIFGLRSSFSSVQFIDSSPSLLFNFEITALAHPVGKKISPSGFDLPAFF